MNNHPWRKAHRILCVRLDNLGDVLMCTPAMRALKHSLPQRHLTLLASGSGAAAARFIPEVDDAIQYAAPWMKSSAPHEPAYDAAMIDQLHALHFDGAVIFTSYSQSPLPAALLCHMAGIPLRIAHCRENPYQLLSDWIPEREPHDMVRHEVRRQLDLVASIGGHTGDERLSFRIAAADASWARHHLAALGLNLDQPWLLLHPGASAPSRRYPLPLWVEAANRLATESCCPLVFTGNAEEAPLVDTIRRALAGPSLSLAGTLDLGKFAAVLALAPVIISNNTGPAHLGAALGTPVVDLYALTNPQHTPWRVPSRVLYHDVPCRICYKSVCPQGHHDCLAKIAPKRVVEAAIDLLRVGRASNGGRADVPPQSQPAAPIETAVPPSPPVVLGDAIVRR